MLIDMEVISCSIMGAGILVGSVVINVKEEIKKRKEEKIRHSAELRQRVAEMERQDSYKRYRMFRNPLNTEEPAQPIRIVKGVFAKEYAEHEKEFWNGTYAVKHKKRKCEKNESAALA